MDNRWGYGQSIVEFWPISLIFNVVVTLLIGVGSAIGLNSWFRHQSLRLSHLLVVTIWVACGVAMLIQFETQHGPIYGYEEELDERPEIIKRFLYDDEFALDYLALGIVFLALGVFLFSLPLVSGLLIQRWKRTSDSAERPSTAGSGDNR